MLTVLTSPFLSASEWKNTRRTEEMGKKTAQKLGIFVREDKEVASYFAFLIDRLQSSCFADNIYTFSVTQLQRKYVSVKHKRCKQDGTHLAICERVSKSKLFIDVLTSRQPMYCNGETKTCQFEKKRKTRVRIWGRNDREIFGLRAKFSLSGWPR